jgi:antitoxin FitA
MQIGAVPSIQIKDVPTETHAVLPKRALAAHQSPQEYLLARFIAEASVPTLDEVLDRAGGRAWGVLSLSLAVADLKEDRAPR